MNNIYVQKYYFYEIDFKSVKMNRQVCYVEKTESLIIKLNIRLKNKQF